MATKIKTSAAARAKAAARAQYLVETSSLVSAEGWDNTIGAVKAAIGKANPKSEKPADKALFALTRHSFQAGRIAYLLYRGSNLPIDERLAKGREVRDAADGDGKGKLKAGQTRRRTRVEQAAYNAAKTAWSRLLSDAGIKTSEKRGGNVAPKANKAPDKSPDKSATVPAAVAAKYMPPKSADKETAVAYVRQQLKLLSTFIEAANQRAMKASGETLPLAMCSAVSDCCKAVDAVK